MIDDSGRAINGVNLLEVFFNLSKIISFSTRSCESFRFITEESLFVKNTGDVERSTGWLTVTFTMQEYVTVFYSTSYELFNSCLLWEFKPFERILNFWDRSTRQNWSGKIFQGSQFAFHESA